MAMGLKLPSHSLQHDDRPMQKDLTNKDIDQAWFTTKPLALKPLDAKAADAHVNDLLYRLKEEGLDAIHQRLKAKGPWRDFFSAILDLSPFLREALTIRPTILAELDEVSLTGKIESTITAIAGMGLTADSETHLMADLRKAKSEAHALIALGDLAGQFGGAKTTELVSRLAIACTRAAVCLLLREAHNAGKLTLPDPSNPENGSGWILLGMGKLGALELNYSSDIDLIVLFDPQADVLPDRWEGIETFSRLTRRLVRIMQDRTADGYVFRTDLRLRPDPGSTPLAIPVEAALNYYEGRGQNWERAALIKALPLAGDIEAGNRFLKEIVPFIWRKYLDYAAIADVHSIKRQIHAHKGHGEIAIHGHNVKLGRGGIREVEFFVQTQQLIAGGRAPDLRGRRTDDMLAKLAETGWITEQASQALTREYWFLRDVEHRTQMVADEQTHNLPDDDEGVLRIARMAGFDTVEAFSERLQTAMLTVERHYAALFETEKELSAGIGNLVFTGDNDDPGTIETLTNLGFKRPGDMCQIIRTWHFGRYKATQSSEARERLTELTPALLKAFGSSMAPDDTLLRFDAFMQGLPSGIQLFSLLQTNPALLDLLVLIMGAAPRLSEAITRKPHIFDGLLDPAIYRDMPTTTYLLERLNNFMDGVGGYEENLDRLRIFASEQKFLIGVRMLTGALQPVNAGKALSDLADLILQRTLRLVQDEFARKHGRIEGAEAAILGFGKLGSRELTAGSDVDLVLLYEHPDDAGESDGEKPLYPSHYYARLTQRLIAAVSAPTGEGVLYELDLRLRPSGNKGPVATRLAAFKQYQHEEAWTWEHMALSRARVVAADAGFAAPVEAVITQVLQSSHDLKKVDADVAEMRGLIEQEKPAKGFWDFKLMPGGLIDLEFIAQAAMMSGRAGGFVSTRTEDVLNHVAIDGITAEQLQILATAHRLYSSLTQILRLCLEDDVKEESVSAALMEILCRAAELPDGNTLKAHISNTGKQVREIFRPVVPYTAQKNVMGHAFCETASGVSMQRNLK